MRIPKWWCSTNESGYHTWHVRWIFLIFFAMQMTGYRFLDGIEELLQELKLAGVEMHIMSNYPVWYKRIEAKLVLTKFMPWTFVSCDGPMKVGCFQCSWVIYLTMNTRNVTFPYHSQVHHCIRVMKILTSSHDQPGVFAKILVGKDFH